MMQGPQPNINQNQQQQVLIQRKDPIPFFYKIIVTTIIILAVIGIFQPETRIKLANIYSDVFYKAQIWRLFTNQFVTIGSIDCIYTVAFSYMSIAAFEKKVGSATFIVDFVLISLLISISSVFFNLFVSVVFGQLQQAVLLKHSRGFISLWFFYTSRNCFLEPENDMYIFCFVIKQKNFSTVMFLFLFIMNSFNFVLIITVSYLLIVIQNYCFKNRFFTFKYSLYFKIQKLLGKLTQRDDFYKVRQCKQYSMSFIRNYNEHQILAMQLQQILQRARNNNVIFQYDQNMRDQVQLSNENNNTQQNIDIKQRSQYDTLSQTTQQYYDHNDSRMEINNETQETLPNI